MSDDTACRECVTLARHLPHALRFLELSKYEYAGRSFRIASFALSGTSDESTFVLVPGGKVQLGFAPDAYRPTKRQIASFTKGARALGIERNIHEFIDSYTSKVRMVDLPSMLFEVQAKKLSSEAVEENDSAFQALRDYIARFKRANETWHKISSFDEQADTYLITRGDNGEPRLWREPVMKHGDVVAHVTGAGLRLPSSDEWEYACGVGSTHLFRWGNDWPETYAPCSKQAQRNWRPNLFGLRIAEDPYRMDIVTDDPLALGGDGGCSCCGGYGNFFEWLPLATAYQGAPLCDRDEPLDFDYYRVRRVIDIG